MFKLPGLTGHRIPFRKQLNYFAMADIKNLLDSLTVFVNAAFSMLITEQSKYFLF